MFGIKSMDCMTQRVGKLSECHWVKQALDREMLAKVFSAFTPKRGHPPSGPFSAPTPPGELGVARHDGKDLKIPGESPTWHAHTMLIWVSKLLSFNNITVLYTRHWEYTDENTKVLLSRRLWST